MFKKILNTFRKAKTTPEAPSGTSKDPKPVSDVPLIEGVANQVDTRAIRLNTVDVARTQTRGTSVGGATLIDPIKF